MTDLATCPACPDHVSTPVELRHGTVRLDCRGCGSTLEASRAGTGRVHVEVISLRVPAGDNPQHRKDAREGSRGTAGARAVSGAGGGSVRQPNGGFTREQGSSPPAPGSFYAYAATVRAAEKSTLKGSPLAASQPLMPRVDAARRRDQGTGQAGGKPAPASPAPRSMVGRGVGALRDALQLARELKDALTGRG